MTKLTQHFVRLTAVLSSFGLMACPAEDDNDTAADSTLSTSVSTSMTTTDPGESSSDPTNASAEETTDPTDPTAETTDPTADTTDPTMPQDTGGDCLPTDECQDDSMCAGGMCIGCICIGGGETGATMSDYGACDMCAAGETATAITGLDGFCFCAPACDGMSCPEPTSGAGGMAVCGLGMDAMNPTLCVVVCQDDTNCPTGASCEVLSTPNGDVGLCTHPPA